MKKGSQHTETTKRKMSASSKGQHAWNRGINGMHHTEATKRKIGLASKGRCPTEETKHRMSEAHKGNQYAKGCKHSEKARQNHRSARAKQVIPIKDTMIEVALQKELRDRKIPFTPHKYLLGHRVDLFIEPDICVECDGTYWHNLPKMKARDERLNALYQQAGYLMLRYTDKELNANVEGCMDEIEDVYITRGV